MMDDDPWDSYLHISIDTGTATAVTAVTTVTTVKQQTKSERQKNERKEERRKREKEKKKEKVDQNRRRPREVEIPLQDRQDATCHRSRRIILSIGSILFI